MSGKRIIVFLQFMSGGTGEPAPKVRKDKTWRRENPKRESTGGADKTKPTARTFVWNEASKSSAGRDGSIADERPRVGARHQPAHQAAMQVVPRLERHHMTEEGPPQQAEVADEVEQLVADKLIGKAKC